MITNLITAKKHKRAKKELTNNITIKLTVVVIVVVVVYTTL